jgi:hydroxymethylglutaryl-CoA lyase
MLHEMDVDTGIDLPKLLEAVAYAESIFGRQLPGQLLHAGPPEWDISAA